VKINITQEAILITDSATGISEDDLRRWARTGTPKPSLSAQTNAINDTSGTTLNLGRIGRFGVGSKSKPRRVTTASTPSPSFATKM
jgi:hypothetical protein